ncbi:hypothetical protein Tco_1130169 [Tanacetum coccineum]
MEMKDTLSLCSNSEEREMQRLQQKARISKASSMNGLRTLRFHFKYLSLVLQDFGDAASTFTRTFFEDMNKLEKHLIEEKLHENDCKTALTALRTMLEKIFNSELLKFLNFNFKKYTGLETQPFKDAMIVVMENTCFGKENSSSETVFSKSVKKSSLDSETKDVHAIKYKMSKVKKRCMAYVRSLHSHLQVLSKEDLKGTRIEHGFKWAFLSLFGQDDDTFTSMMFLSVDKLQKQINKDEFQDGSMVAFWVLNR